MPVEIFELKVTAKIGEEEKKKHALLDPNKDNSCGGENRHQKAAEFAEKMNEILKRRNER